MISVRIMACAGASELVEKDGEASQVMVPGGLTVLEVLPVLLLSQRCWQAVLRAGSNVVCQLQAVRKGEEAVQQSISGQVVGIQRAQIEDIWEIQMKLAAHTHMAAEDLLRGIPLACRHTVFLQVRSLAKLA